MKIIIPLLVAMDDGDTEPMPPFAVNALKLFVVESLQTSLLNGFNEHLKGIHALNVKVSITALKEVQPGK